MRLSARFAKGFVRDPWRASFLEYLILGAMRMSEQEAQHDGESIPLMQQLLDSPFILLFLGVTIPTVVYIIWGIMEIIAIPVAP
ncbi:MAG: hypothetical protein COB59_01365 [Rhodospirillaceae bacterium]|nr:MAG: hypothetical protein COB59_01365 [Rhodospirillaceae bacterium]